MADISLRIKTDFEQAQKDFKNLAEISESTRNKIEQFSKKITTESIDRFSDRNKLASIAVRATRGELAGMQTEYRGLQREIERLIKAGMSPQDAALKKLTTRYSELDKEIQKTTKMTSGFGNIIKGIIGANLIQRGMDGIVSGFKNIIKEAMKIEDATAAFTPLMGSLAGAEKLVEALNIQAASTPYQFEQVAAVAKQLLPVMEGDIGKVTEAFRFLGDTAGGNAEKLQTITRGFTKAMLKGKVDMESLNMIAEAGVPIFAEMAKTMGYGKKEMGAFFKQISTGKVSTDTLIKTFQNMTSEGGIFFNGMIIASKTTSGVFSTLRDNVAMVSAGIGNAFLPLIKEAAIEFINVSSGVLQWVTENKKLISSGIQTFFSVIGTSLSIIAQVLPVATAAWLAYTVVTKASAAATWLQVAATKALTVAMSINPVGLMIAAIAALIVIGIKLYNNWDAVKKRMAQIFDSMRMSGEIAWEKLKLGFLYAMKGITAAVLLPYRPFVWMINKMIGALNSLSGQNIAKIGGSIKAFTSSIDGDITDAHKKISKLESERAKKAAEIARAQAKASASISDSKRKEASSFNAANASMKASESGKFKSFQHYLKSARETDKQKIEEAQKFFQKRAEAETDDFTKRIEFLQAQNEIIKGIEFASQEERRLAEIGLTRAIQEEERKRTAMRAAFGQSVLSSARSTLEDLQVVFKNAGKDTRKLALMLRGVAIAEATINSFVAYTKALKEFPTPFNYIAAGAVLLAGIAKVAAISSTPIPTAQTGLTDYVVPESRSNRNDGAAVKAAAGETVSVTPRGENTQKDMIVNVQIEDSTLIRVIQRYIDTGKINVSNRNIGRGVFAT